ncbi:phage/plasmid primase, P4 family [Aurantimonas sp. VKM B-3413]|uniref:DNA primase family protein n=1 Tax=Aurantimonas sp. VKM B-3413 TaxID=2779401 RepID=UPI001E4FE26D|nr:DNA primase family protein [Aurantimonas sp. VKM B-3413]MCB8835953.1 phage/plasmid primase, P4 family [Aurantimonas sp. VKM B-3413]
MAKRDDSGLAAVQAILARASAMASGTVLPAEPEAREPVSAGTIRVNGREIPQGADPESVDEIVSGFCADLHQSDTDNGIRLIAHFGRDIRVLAQEKADKPLFVVWTGRHWDINQGRPRAQRVAQRLGGRILGEIAFLKPSQKQAAVLEAAVTLRARPAEELSPADKLVLNEAAAIEKGIAGARKARRDFAISCENSARLKSMLEQAAPHLITDPEAFNADRLKVAVRNATLSFSARDVLEVNPEAEREDAPAETPDHIRVRRGTLHVERGHRREDMISEVVPVAYDAGATCPAWRAFLDEYLPDPAVRRMVQVAFGLGLLGVTVQKLFFHYGNGANGKSVCMEVICRVLGQSAVTLPSSSFFGPSGQAGAASPDIARLYGRRLLRVKELPKGEPLREDLVKELTGGETMTGRDLFAGYFDFRPIFTVHMSGNNYPTITGTDDGIWRRMAVVLWPKTIPIDARRDFEDVVAGFEPEHAGILNWLIEGALIYLEEGLQIPETVQRETQKYRDEMDPTAAFVAAHVRPRPGEEVTARDLYHAYFSWAEGSSVKPISETAFGRNMAKKFTREDGRVRKYRDITLIDPPRREGDPGTPPEDRPFYDPDLGRFT